MPAHTEEKSAASPDRPETVPSGDNLQSGVGSALPVPDRKREFVLRMFDSIAPRYDFLNSLLSGRLHHRWRRAAVREARVAPGSAALDVCTGTGDLAFELAKAVGATGNVVGADFSEPMLRLGPEKAAKRKSAAVAPIEWALADAQELPFPPNSFDAVTVGFGVRNVANIQRAIDEMARVARPGGRVVILEFSQPRNRVFAALYGWYSFRILPWLGGLISGERSAYEYLPSSVSAFYSREALAHMMTGAGLDSVNYKDLVMGSVVIHSGTKK